MGGLGQWLRNRFRKIFSLADSREIAETGNRAGIALIIGAIAKKSEYFECEGQTIAAGRLASRMGASADIQATLKTIEHVVSREGHGVSRAIAVFNMRCPQNDWCNNSVDHFHEFFRTLGFDAYADQGDYNTLPDGDNWYAHVNGGSFTPAAVQKYQGHFEIAVPFDGLLKNLGINPGSYMAEMQLEQGRRVAKNSVSPPG